MKLREFSRVVLGLAACLLASMSFAEERYFPDGSLSDKAELHRDRHAYYRQVFEAFGEPSLLSRIEKDKLGDDRIYRFTWLRSFQRPVCITIASNEKETKLTLKVLDGKGGYVKRLGKVVEEKTIVVKREEVEAFEKLLEDADFANASSQAESAGDWFWDSESRKWGQWNGTHTTDGSGWLLEHCVGNTYRFVERRNAQKTSFGKACLHLLKLSGYDDGKVY